jgi:hypothetical protein
MNSYIALFLIMVAGFVVYFLIRDKIFDPVVLSTPSAIETFEIPAPASIEIRQAPIYPKRVVASSGPNPPSQASPNNEMVVYSEPRPKDPYYEAQESSDIPENLRYPENSFRPPPRNDNTSIAVQAGIASPTLQVSSDNSQKMQPEFIQGGGEFMPGIFANDTYNDNNFSAF